MKQRERENLLMFTTSHKSEKQYYNSNWMPKASQEHHEHQKDGWCYEAGDWSQAGY
jgi:hypothetical protein